MGATLQVPPAFKIVLIVVTGFTLMSFVGLAALAIFGNGDPNHPNQAQQSFSIACDIGWKSGLGAILGLLGGKVTS